MANKKWYDATIVDSDCLDGSTTWLDLVEYIKHTKCLDVTFYSTCTSGGTKAFEFKTNTINIEEDRAIYINQDKTYIGHGAGDNITAGEGVSNTFVGHDSGFTTTIGDRNTFVGMNSGYSNIISSGIVCLGYSAGQNNTVGDTLYINNNSSAFPLIWGDFANDVLSFGNNNDYFYAHLLHENSGGILYLKECTTPTAKANYGSLYFKADNKLYCQTGDGIEHEVTMS